MDTVHPADPPFRMLTHRDDGTLVGPGVAEMKGGIAEMLAALVAFEAGPARIEGDEFLIVASLAERAALWALTILRLADTAGL